MRSVRWRPVGWGLGVLLLVAACGDGRGGGELPADPATPVKETPRPKQATQGEAIAHVELVDGSVQVRDRNGELFPAQVGLPILKDDVFITAAGGFLLAELHNGYVVNVDEDLEFHVNDIPMLDAPRAKQGFEAQLEAILASGERSRIGGSAAMSERIAGWQSRLESGTNLPSESRGERAVAAAPPPETAAKAGDGGGAEIGYGGGGGENMGAPPTTGSSAKSARAEADEDEDKAKSEAGVPQRASSKEKKKLEKSPPDNKPTKTGKSSGSPAEQSASQPAPGSAPQGRPASELPDDADESPSEIEEELEELDAPEDAKAAPPTASISWSIEHDGKDTPKGATLVAPFASEAARADLEAAARELAERFPALGSRVHLMFRVHEGRVTRVVVKGGAPTPASLHKFVKQSVALDVSSGDVWVVLHVELR